MAYLLGSIAGALVVMFLLSRLVRWALKRMGDTEARIFVTGLVTYAIGVVLAGFGNADGGPWNPGSSLIFYAIGAAACVGFDWFALKGRLANRKPTRLS